MTESDDQRYSIEKLLSQTVQPFPDLPPDEFEVLRQSIKVRGLINPILLTADGYLFDGHQRLKALLANGRKQIYAKDVIIKENVTRENMLGYAYTSNLVRRMQTTEEKVARMYQCEKMGWSQRRIAKEFHVSQSAVSQLMAAHPPADDETPELIITHGADGKTYTRSRGGRKKKDTEFYDNTERSTAYDHRQRLKKRLAEMRASGAHLLADAAACGTVDGFEMGGIREDVAAVKTTLDAMITTLDHAREAKN
jgi:ParB-like chromosome segregation protein Spo0J